jgi:autotransporter-associated beta strand protein
MTLTASWLSPSPALAQTFFVGEGQSLTVFTQISGSGGVTKTGAGRLVLWPGPGPNTYTGATTIESGTVETHRGTNAIGDQSAVNVFSGARLLIEGEETIGSLEGAGAVRLKGPLTTGSNSSSTTFSGILSGGFSGEFESLTKVGTGTFTLSGANTINGLYTVSAGTLAVSGGSAISDISLVTILSGANLSLLGNETIGSLEGAGTVSLGANTLTTGAGYYGWTTFTGSIIGSGGLTKVGSGQMSTGDLAYTGTTTVNGGALNINGTVAGSVAVNSGTLSGATRVGGNATVNGGTLNINGTVAGSVVVNSGGTLSGNTSIAGNLTLNAGGALASGNSPGTTNVAGNFIGGGVLNVEVQFNNAAAPVNGTTHDFLNITGNASGNSSIAITNIAGPAVLTKGNGIELVRVGGTTNAGAFALATTPVVVDGIPYALQYLPNQPGGASSFFLQSALPDDILGQAAMLTAGRRLLARCHRGPERASAQGAGKGVRSWAKYGTGSIKTGADTGIEADQSFSCGAGGIDTASASDLRFGIVGGFGSTEVDITTLVGSARLDGDLGLIEAQASYVKDGLFFSLSAGYASTDWIFESMRSGVLLAAVDGMVGSLMAGHEWTLYEDWKVAVSGELSYDGTSCSVPQCMLGLPGTVAEENNWRAGLAAKVSSGTQRSFRPFVEVSWSNELGSTTIARASNAGVSAMVDTAPNLMGARAGFEADLTNNIGLFVDVGMSGAVADANASVSGFDGQAGLRVSW